MRNLTLTLATLIVVTGCSGKDVEPPVEPVDMDGDGFAVEDDCDDTNSSIHPGAAELCDGVDNNCDGTLDDDVPVWFNDADGDRFGAGDPVEACTQPANHVSVDGDCNDSDSTISPTASEACDGVDNNCDGDIDENAPSWNRDADGDGFGSTETVQACEVPAGYTDNDDDCNDGDGSAYPGAPEFCDGIDSNCDEAPDTGVTRYSGYVSPTSYESRTMMDASDVYFVEDGIVHFNVCSEVEGAFWVYNAGTEVTVTGVGDARLSQGPSASPLFAGFGSKLVVKDLTIVGAESTAGSAAIWAYENSRLDLNNVLVDAPVGSTSYGAIVANNAVIRLTNTTVDGYLGSGIGALQITQQYILAKNSLITNGMGPTTEGAVGATIGGGGLLHIEDTLIEDNTGYAVIEQLEHSYFKCVGVPGVETGMINNDATSFGFDWSFADHSSKRIYWEQIDCDFGEGASTQQFDVIWTNRTWATYLGNDRTSKGL